MITSALIISTKVGQAIDIINYNHDGLLADKQNPKLIEDLASYLLGNRNLYQNISNNSLKTSINYMYSKLKNDWINVLS